MDDIDLGKLEALVVLMRRLGIKSVGSVELFAAEPLPAQPVSDKDLEALEGKMPTPEDLTFWSVSGPLPSEVSDSSRPPEEP